MVSKTTTIVNPQGFHMRPAGAFCNALAPFSSKITIRAGEKTVNAKSLMNVIAACLKCGMEVEVAAEGPDENEALECAVSMIDNGLGEM